MAKAYIPLTNRNLPDFIIPSKERKVIPIRTASNSSEQDGDSTPTSTLDIYSRNYIPLWLRAVNDSFANLQQCPTFPMLDFDSYISTLVGPDFVKPVPKAHIPPPTPSNPSGELTVVNYRSYWTQLLQEEFACQNLQLQAYALYHKQLTPIHGTERFFGLHVPGLRENTPRIDLGDVVHIRRLVPTVNVEFQVANWLQHGNGICPGFSGVLYNPQVWEINRAKETITLCIPGYPSANCNVIFLQQESNLEPICRAITASNPWLDKMLFPEIHDGVEQKTLSQAFFDIQWVDKLNREQMKAVHTILKANYGTLPYLISGPPGTGKTKTLVETALQLIAKQGHLLICAPSDAAADTLALRLSEHLQPNELFRLNGSTRTFAEVPDRLLTYTFSETLSFSLPPVEQLLSYRIVVTTCRDADMLNRARITNICLHNLFNGVRNLLTPESQPHPLHWTALLLDEAAQATEPDTLIPLTVVMPPPNTTPPQFIAAGDQFQLGPKLASKTKLEISLFQRLFERPTYDDHPLSRKKNVTFITSKLLPMMRPAFTNLIRNYRSHPAILSVPSSLFYNDTLITERKTSESILTWPNWTSPEKWPVLFHQNESPDAYESITLGDGTGYGTLYNPGEANIALQLVRSLLRHTSSLDPKEIVVMSPFKAQVTQLRQIFRSSRLYDVNIGPLEAFQGLESRIVIICTTRTRLGKTPDHHVLIDKSRGLGIVDEPKRFNVAMTRAQEGLIVIGNAHCLISTRDTIWLNFLDFCKRNDCFTPKFNWPDLGGPYEQGRLERALVYAALGKAEIDREPPRFMKGFQEMDEQMWQFKELAQHDNDEIEDLVIDLPDEDMEHYDRNLKREFHTECNTQ